MDFDGEVFIDPQLEQPNLDLNKFKTHIQITQHIKKALDPKRLRDLFDNILNNWNELCKTGTFLFFNN